MSIAKIQTGDKVKVIAGSHKGSVGVVTKIVKRVRPGKGIQVRASVSSLPKIVKYRKANKSYNLPGQMGTTDRLLDVSNLALVMADDQISKVSVQTDDNGKKIRVFKKTNQPVVKHELPQSPSVDEAKDTDKSN